MRILLTGGTGYIGSHTSIVLLEAGFDLVIVDSFDNSSPKVIEKIRKILGISEAEFNKRVFLREGDIRSYKFLKKVFEEFSATPNRIEAVIHFAGLKSVSESSEKPLLYWDVNVKGSINLLLVMQYFKCFNIVFSSSCTLYGESGVDLISENARVQPMNPYGFSKATVENILSDIAKNMKDQWSIASLRYFNPIGAHSSGIIGENPKNIPTNLFPILCDTAYGKRKILNIYGDNWPTHDGTCIRDYIHVMDLAEGHLETMKYLISKKNKLLKLNLGTGTGYSVLDLVKEFEKQSGRKINYQIVERRKGDACRAVANPELAREIIGWKTKRSLAKMCSDGWNWFINNPNGY